MGGVVSHAIGLTSMSEAPMTERDLCITFAGGGNKSFYQFGLMRRWGGRLLPRTRVLAACSAGACVAALLLSGRERQVEEFWRRRGGVTKNFEWRRLLAGQRPTPHERLYRDLLLCAFADGGLESIRSQPFPLLVLTTAFPRRMPALAAAFLGLCVHSLEQRMSSATARIPLSRRVGFSPLVFDARQCESPEELADLIIASSATPPFTSVGRVRGLRLLDGGIIDCAPAFLADEVSGVRRVVVLLTVPRPQTASETNGRLYIAPQSALPVTTWDFTRPDLLKATIELGERDAELYERQLADFINLDAPRYEQNLFID